MAEDFTRSPKRHTARIVLAAVAAGSDLTTVLCRVPFDGAVKSVTYIPKAAAAGHATNNRVFTVTNRGVDGTGTAALFTLSQLAGVDLAAYVPKAFSRTPLENRVVVTGEVLSIQSVHGGTGVADPGGTLEIEFADGDGGDE